MLVFSIFTVKSLEQTGKRNKKNINMIAKPKMKIFV